jgi:hypothetical protein
VSDELPDGVDRAAMITHALAANVMGDLINRAARYMSADVGSAEEALAEVELEAGMGTYVVELSPESMGQVLMMFTSLIIDVCEPKDVQAWFDHKAQMMKAVFGDAD